MSISPQFLDDIRARVALNEVAGRHSTLRRQGTEYTGLCPFHDEKTPSFTINEDKGFFHCFGCGAHGDIFGFLMRAEGLSFVEAVHRLATECGLDVPRQSPRDDEKARRIDSLLKVNELADGWFQQCLYADIGECAQRYLSKRGLDDKTIRYFGLGFAPEKGNQLLEFLSKKGVDETTSLAAGLVRKPDDNRPCYDFFRGRIIFPISDYRGRIIGFGGRSIKESKAKYINSPETEVFRKGHALYNLSNARTPGRQTTTMIVAEGYMDVIALCRSGFPNTVAPLGTALTENQIQQLWRFVPEPVLCFDGDEAGQRAARRAAEHTLPNLSAGLSLRFAFLPTGEDPDSMITKGDREILARAIQNPISLIDYIWSCEVDNRPLDTPERKASFQQRLNKLVSQIKDKAIRDGYFLHFKDKMRGHFTTRQFSAPPKGGGYSPNVRRNVLQTHTRGHQRTGDPNHRERVLVAILIGHPELLVEVRDDFARLEIHNGSLDLLRSALLEISTKESEMDYQSTRAHLSDRGHGEILAKLFDRKEWNQTITERSVRPETDTESALIAWREAFAIHCERGKTPGLS